MSPENLPRLLELLGSPDESSATRLAAARGVEQVVARLRTEQLVALEARLAEIDRANPPHDVWTAVKRLSTRIVAWRRTGRDAGRPYVIELSTDEIAELEQRLSHCFANRYRIQREIASGGMGRVFEAQRVEDGLTVVVKYLLDTLVDRPDIRERFRREAEVLEGLAHPNVVSCYEHGATDEDLYLVMEYVAGGSLDRLVGSADLSPARAASLLVALCDGLAAVHAAGIVHRDIKPANVLLDADTQAKLTDFGLAMVSGGERLTRPFEDFGTEQYMSPEQRRSAGEVDLRADIWSLGVMAYELFSGGRFPEVDYRPLGDIVPGLPTALDDVVRRSLKVDPGERWPSAAEFRGALERAMES